LRLLKEGKIPLMAEGGSVEGHELAEKYGIAGANYGG
jgi:hypothetical protein